MDIGKKLLTINNYVGKIISVSKDTITVVYEKDNTTEDFKNHQFSSVEYMIRRYNERYSN